MSLNGTCYRAKAWTAQQSKLKIKLLATKVLQDLGSLSSEANI